jgi:hypothetical protein
VVSSPGQPDTNSLKVDFMKFKVLSAVLIFTSLTGCAFDSDLQRTNSQSKAIEEQVVSLDMRIQRLEQTKKAESQKLLTQFCFMNNQMFSEGSYYLGKTCTRATGMTVYQAGQPVVYPLIWK